ncbi:MAG: hypothetical protein DI598_17615 [Pseudopedobacter saltans]|uniref:Secretion system C-terminal sorting domain-containing protein n=1 Tax=Pseudopedobacter saltans TaxID=151895 RepID=A0A2W5EIP7_9SPHI|nr:MAG: hypothetical protein DI598_17615 [Pseudopedobacter saltans]
MTKILLKTLFTFAITTAFFLTKVDAKDYTLKNIACKDSVYVNPYASLVENKLVTKYYPNPARDFINFEFDKKLENNSRLIVYSFTGTKMSDIQISNLKVTINLSEYYRGIYLFQLTSPKGQVLESGKFQVLK